MHYRCYRSNKPAYQNTTVCPEWHTFANFEAWAVKQPWEGNDLDKDIIQPGNQVYCPELCAYVPQALNKAIKVGRGVTFHKTGRPRPWQTTIRKGGRQLSFGYYATEEQAHAVYVEHKRAHLLELAAAQQDIRLRDGLLRHAALLF